MFAYVPSIVTGDGILVHIGCHATSYAAAVLAPVHVRKNGLRKAGFANISTERQCGSKAFRFLPSRQVCVNITNSLRG